MKYNMKNSSQILDNNINFDHYGRDRCLSKDSTSYLNDGVAFLKLQKDKDISRKIVSVNLVSKCRSKIISLKNR